MENNLLYNLQVISKLEKNDKLMIVNDEELDVDRRHLQSVRRYMAGDSRDGILSFLKDMFTCLDAEIDKLVNTYRSNSTPTETLDNINDILHDFYLSITNAKKGFLNLLNTYENDTAVKTKLELYYNTLDRKSLSLKKKLNIT